ncbi:hypothetical protein [uncultured Microbacterium sp.]|uniref:hypothetical protein n=1 Tax=uncultured Microbacterium sp. TaxID=191216 RepID=UPI0035CB1F0F
MSKNVPTSAPPLSMTAVVAFFLGAVAAGFAFYADAASKPLIGIVAVLAVIVGVVAIILARRNTLSGSWMAYIGAALGVAAMVVLVVWPIR